MTELRLSVCICKVERTALAARGGSEESMNYSSKRFHSLSANVSYPLLHVTSVLH